MHSLASQSERLKQQLLDDQIAEITDERLLTNGLLDSLLVESPDYEAIYRVKARDAVLKIYYSVAARQRAESPKQFWKGAQGLINAGIIVHRLVSKEGWEVDKNIFQKFTAKWAQRHILGKALYNYGLYQLLIAGYPEYAFNPAQPFTFHLHRWDIGNIQKWDEESIQRAVRHIVRFHMPTKFTLRKLVSHFSQDFIESQNLSGLLYTLRFEGTPYRLFIAGFPEYNFDPTYPDRPHIHPWDAAKIFWSDLLVKEAVQHMVKYHTDWADEEIGIKATGPWLKEQGLTTPLDKRFNGSRLRLLQFVYPELFQQEILSENDFSHLHLGLGTGRFRHPLRTIPEKGRPIIMMGKVFYYFPLHHGHLVHKFSREYGALYTPDKQLMGLFKWSTNPDAKRVSVRSRDIEHVLPELTRPRSRVAFAEAVRILSEQAQIIVHDLSLKDEMALIDALNAVEPARVVDYLKLTGSLGLRVMADTEFPDALILIHEMFDPLQFRQVITNYCDINAKLEKIATLFTRYVTAISPEELDAFRTEIADQLFLASDRILNGLSRVLVYSNMTAVARETLIADVLQAQRDLSAILQFLEAFGKGALRAMKLRIRPDGAREIQYRTPVVFVNLILRERESRQGQAAIRFHIVPHTPLDKGLSPEISFRLDRERTNRTALDIVSEAFERLGRIDRDFFPNGYHYTIPGAQFAEETFFAEIVRSFLPTGSTR